MNTWCPVMALPFSVPAVTRGFAALTPRARETGRLAAESISRALSELIGVAVEISGQPLPSQAMRGLGVASVRFSLEGVPATAALEVDARLLARTVEQLAGRLPRTPSALTASQVEQSVLELIALVALDAARSPPLEALVPRLGGEGEAPPGALAIALEIGVGGDRGLGRLLVPQGAVLALSGAARDLHETLAALPVVASFRKGSCSLSEEDLSALGPGDVLLLDEGAPLDEVVLPGGLSLRGRTEGDELHIEEVRMTETQASYPLIVTIEIARVTVTLGDLARLEPGAALPLHVAKDGAVVLRTGERAIARGQLVDVDGALGVRVMQLGERP